MCVYVSLYGVVQDVPQRERARHAENEGGEGKAYHQRLFLKGTMEGGEKDKTRRSAARRR